MLNIMISRSLYLTLISMFTIMSTLLINPACAKEIHDHTSLRNLFLQVDQDLKAGKLNSYRTHQQRLQEYPLYPYLKYQVLKMNFENVSLTEVEQFHDKYNDSPLAHNLRTEWLKLQASKEKWLDYIKGYIDSDNIELKCNFMYSYIQVKDYNDIEKHIPSLWLHKNNNSKSCDKVFAEWQKRGGMNSSYVWQRIQVALDTNNINAARYLSKLLNAEDRKMLELWIRVHSAPNMITKQLYFNNNNPITSDILTTGMVKLIKSNPTEALNTWQQIKNDYSFSRHNYGTIVKNFSVAFANKGLDFAQKWLSMVPNDFMDEIVFDSTLKWCLKNGKWSEIIKTYAKLPEAIKNTEKWSYWYARAEYNMGNTELAKNLLRRIHHKRSYYGFLASLRLNQPFNVNYIPLKVPDHKIAETKQRGCAIRAIELKKINRDTDGHREWQSCLAKTSEIERQSLAIVAYEHGFDHWAILSLANTSEQNDLRIRFPKPYWQQIEYESKRNRLDPAIIYAITRQESAFVRTARSKAGALGLMQVMPGTAKMVSRQFNLRYRNQHDLLDVKTNVAIGSRYLKQMLDKHQNNLILAAAAYNAGPKRVEEWLPDKDTATDVWVETIPFSETRNYVQNILTYSLIYQNLLYQQSDQKLFVPLIRKK